MCILAVAVIGIFAFLRQPSFGKLPSGERLERIRRSPNYQGGQFRNLQPTAMMTGKKSRSFPTGVVYIRRNLYHRSRQT